MVFLPECYDLVGTTPAQQHSSEKGMFFQARKFTKLKCPEAKTSSHTIQCIVCVFERGERGGRARAQARGRERGRKSVMERERKTLSVQFQAMSIMWQCAVS